MARHGPLMRVDEVARELGVSASYAYRLIQSGALPSVRVGGRIVVPRAAWTAWLAQRSAEALASVRAETAP